MESAIAGYIDTNSQSWPMVMEQTQTQDTNSNMEVFVMTWQFFSFLATVSVAALFGFGFDEKQKIQDEEAKARKYLHHLENEFSKRATRTALVRWAYASNITEENLMNQMAVEAEDAKFVKEKWMETIKYPWTTYKDPDIRRRFQKHSVLGYAALKADKLRKYMELVSNMSSIYSKAMICDYKDPKKCDLSLEPGHIFLMSLIVT